MERSFWCHRFDQNILRISALNFFVAAWRLPGSFLGLPGDLVRIIIKKAYRRPKKASRKPQGSYTNFQGRNPYNIFIVFVLVKTITPERHFEITWPLARGHFDLLLGSSLIECSIYWQRKLLFSNRWLYSVPGKQKGFVLFQFL